MRLTLSNLSQESKNLQLPRSSLNRKATDSRVVKSNNKTRQALSEGKDNFREATLARPNLLTRSRSKDEQQKIIDGARTPFADFLLDVLEKEYIDNIYSDFYDFNRALSDGRAKLAEKLYLLIKELQDG